jgi:hypothetical protein
LAVLLFSPGFHSPVLVAQTIYDLDEINADLRVLGAEHGWSNCKIAVLDINDNDSNDFFVGGISHTGGAKVYGFLDFSFGRPNLRLDLRTQSDIIIDSGSELISPGQELISGNFNGDAVVDLLVTDDSHDTVYCFWGSKEWQPGMVINLTTGSADLTVRYDDGQIPTRFFGCDAAACDFNDDGLDDLVIGAYYAPDDQGLMRGAVYVIYGREEFPPDITLPATYADLTILGADPGDILGYSVAVGDVNGDGIDDIAAGAGHAEHYGDGCGRLYIFYGSGFYPAQHLIDLSVDSADLEIKGTNYESWLGISVSIGDINGDGFGDLLLGSTRADSALEGAGAAYCIWGRPDFPSQHFIDLAVEDADITFHGEVEMAHLGHRVSTGDMNGDGCAEMAITAYQSAHNGSTAGAAYVVAGSREFPDTLDIDFAEEAPVLLVWGDDDDDYMIWLSDMADINQDGLADLIVGASEADREDDPDALSAGETYVILSDGTLFNPPRYLAGPGPHQANPPELRLYDPFDHEGWAARFSPYLVRGYGLVSASGDLDGDGYDEIITGPGPGPYHPATVLVLDEQGQRQAAFQAYGTPKYGVNVTSGDLDGDGVGEIVTGAGPGAVYGPHVRGWRWDGGSAVSPIPGVSFLAFGTSRWGVNVVCGDIDGDGNDEIVTGAGPGAVFGPHVRGWNVDGGAASPLSGVSFFAYGTLLWGVNVACGDIDGDGIAEIVTGPGPSEMFASHVRGWNYDGQAVTAMPGVNFIAYQSFPHAMGCVVACGDADNDRVDEILTAPGPHPGNPAYVKTWNYDGDELTLVPGKSFLVFEEGDYVAGARIALGHPYQPPDYLP